MKRVSSKASTVCRGILARTLAFLLTVAMMAVLCPTGVMPAQAETAETADFAEIAEPAQVEVVEPTQVEAADPVQTGTGSGMLLNAITSNAAGSRQLTGVIVGADIDKTKVRTIKFEKTKPSESSEKTCWNAGAGNSGSTGVGDSGTADDSVYACATKTTDGMWDVVYGANGVYPKFPGNSSSLFKGFSGLTGFVGLDQIDTSNVTDMSAMFYECSSLESLTLSSNFVTSSVKSMYCMFYNCSKLPSLTLPSNFDTSNVTDMSYMFTGCLKLVSLDASSFKTSNVTNMSYMFAGCSSLSSLTLSSNFDTSNVTDMSYMFGGCSKLVLLDVSSFKTSKVMNMSYMFGDCSSLSSLTLPSSFDTSSVTNMSYMFGDCSSLSSLTLPSSFVTSSVESMYCMFYNCLKLPSLDVSSFKTSKVTDMRYMFADCSSLSSLTLPSSFDTSSVTSMVCMFSGCSKLPSLDVSSFDTSKVTDMDTMFADCSSLKSLNLSNFVTSSVTNMRQMFADCSSLSSLTLSSSFDTSKVTDMDTMFGGCSSLKSLNLSSFVTSSVTNMRQMFTTCSSLESLDIPKFDTLKVTDMEAMFAACSSLKSLNLSNFDTSSVTNMGQMFAGCSSLTSLDLSKFNTGLVTNSANMLARLYKLQELKLGANFEQSGADCGLKAPYAPAKTGYTATGKWKDTSTGGAAYAPSAVPSSTAATYVTDYAPIAYKVSFRSNGGSGTMGDQSFTYDAAQNLSANTLTRTGYSFTGWNTKADGKGTAYKDKESVKNLTAKANDTVTLYAQWKANAGTNTKYTVKFNANGGTGSMANQQFTYNVAQNLTANAFKRTGYTFAGWNTRADGKGTAYKDKQSVKNLTATANGTVTLYAQWTANSYTVKFNANSGSGSMADQRFTYDAAQNLRANAFKRTGYSFAGWNTKADGKGTAYKDKQSVKNLTATANGTVTLYAQWTANSYTVKFNANSGSGSMANQRFTYDAAQNLRANAFKRTGYTFAGWNTKADGKGTAYKDKQSVKNLTATANGTVTLFAQWKANADTNTNTKYTVKFNANGGTGSMANQQFTYNVAQNLTANAFKRSGYTFAGWNTRADGKGTAYKDKQSVKNLTATANGTVTLYAQWTRSQSQSQGRMVRLSGDTRYDTMSRIVSQAYTGTAKTVIVASGANYPDALSASGLSGVLDAPIVLTDPNGLSSQTAAQLKRLRPSRIIIAGGASAVSANVASQLRSYASSVTRLGGQTRYDTSYLLYEQGGKSWGSTAIVATGAGYADALSVSSYAYAGKAPVFLCDPATGLTAKQRTALSKFKRVVVVGGVQAVPAKYVSGLPGVTRLAGQTRYETSVNIAKWTQKNGLGMDGVVYARGDDYPDALVSGPLAGRNKAPVLLVSGGDNSAVSYSAGFKGKVSKAYVAGGTAAVSKDTANAPADALGVSRP
ncbi:BspA family leucine-rich repeat surface protein [Bifidobacterium panos]|uniref:Internalin A n=1 Tax=Bifidobacterium panos TaxID=2675321 RepID=A0ABX1SWK1_9BIFI|nr:BspA family leucine-rich repeat surface protein [Bifidobacterium sp. DSM 109963]NMN01644.1 internalin A [Bifidobacterium sp. DSM 109963]